MNKFQNVSFADVQECLDYLPEQERAMVNRLRGLIFDCIPHVTERLNYNTPFYFKKKRLCYIWPGSIPWGGIREGVSLGFANGHQLHDEWNFLNKDKKKVIATRIFYSLKEINEHKEIIRTLLFEAAELDEMKSKK